MGHEFILNKTCDESVVAIRRELTAAGLRVEFSFDLRSALSLAHSCTCPHHGTNQCDCQYTVLLVYGASDGPLSLVLHGHDHRCWLTLADHPRGHVGDDLPEVLITVLANAHLITAPQPFNMPQENR